MKKRNDFDRELMTLSRYRSLKITRRYLLISLFSLALFLMTQHMAPKPFYIFLTYGIAPIVFESIFPKAKEQPFQFAYLKYRIGYTKKSFQSHLAAYASVQILMVLWAYSYRSSEFLKPWLKFIPAILIISSFVIYTIGQYYYFLRYRHLVLANQVETISKK